MFRFLYIYYLFLFFFLMIRRPPRSTRTDTLFPYTTLFRSIIVICPDMALRGGLAEPLGRGVDVHGNTATQLVGLTQIELRVRSASRSGWPPLLDRGVIFALFPCIDARLDISHGPARRGAGQTCDAGCQKKLFHVHDSPP